jgi:hypothetical protein
MPDDVVYIGRYRRPVDGRFYIQCPQDGSNKSLIFLSSAEDHGCDTEVTGERTVRYAGHFFFRYI